MVGDNGVSSYEYKRISNITNKSTAIHYIYILYIVRNILHKVLCSESNKQYSFRVRSGLIATLFPTVKIKLLLMLIRQ